VKAFGLHHEPRADERLTWKSLEQSVQQLQGEVIRFELTQQVGEFDQVITHHLGRVPEEVVIMTTNGSFKIWEPDHKARTRNTVTLRTGTDLETFPDGVSVTIRVR